MSNTIANPGSEFAPNRRKRGVLGFLTAAVLATGLGAASAAVLTVNEVESEFAISNCLFKVEGTDSELVGGVDSGQSYYINFDAQASETDPDTGAVVLQEKLDVRVPAGHRTVAYDVFRLEASNCGTDFNVRLKADTVQNLLGENTIDGNWADKGVEMYVSQQVPSIVVSNFSDPSWEQTPLLVQSGQLPGQAAANGLTGEALLEDNSQLSVGFDFISDAVANTAVSGIFRFQVVLEPTGPVPPTMALTAWGGGGVGQLGDGSTTTSAQLTPVVTDTSGVLAGKTVTAIDAGSIHSCAVADGEAFCWGGGGNGRLGNGSTGNRLGPVAVDTSGVLAGKTVTAISADEAHSCAVADGEAFCWGGGVLGRLGNGSTSDQLVPVAVDTSGVLAGKTVTAISAGYYHSCAVADGEAFCWGLGTTGSLGDGSGSNQLVPVAVDSSGVLAGKTVTAISAGYTHTCAVADGEAFCWGRGGNGRLGSGSTSDQFVPVAVDSSGVLAGKTVTDIDADEAHSCAVADGEAFCWGSGGNGRLGSGSTSDQLVPVAVDSSGVLAGKTVTDIDAGSIHSCAVADGEAFCWGGGGNGRLGNGSTSDQLVPVAVDSSGVLAGASVIAISAGGTHTLSG